MSRAREIIRRFVQSNSTIKELSVVDSTTLWPRFQKVHDSIVDTFTDRPPQGITRQLETFNWSGYDEGAHDHKGSIEGEIHGIRLDIMIKGFTFDDNPQYIVKPDGEWQLMHQKKQHIEISGKFISSDGRTGALQVQLTNGKSYYEAFWLEAQKGLLRLEQIVCPNGLVFDADRIEPNEDMVTIPGTRTELHRFRTNN